MSEIQDVFVCGGGLAGFRAAVVAAEASSWLGQQIKNHIARLATLPSP